MIDVDAALEVLEELILEQGNVVYRLDWDSGGPGSGADSERVYTFAGYYWSRSSSEGFAGPYDSLDEALPSDFLVVTEATTEVSCTSWSARELASRLDVADDEALELVVNGERWLADDNHCRPLASDARQSTVTEIGAHPRFRAMGKRVHDTGGRPSAEPARSPSPGA